MPDNDANHSRLAAPQPPIDWEDAVGEMLLSMPDDADSDLDRFKRSLGSAPPVKFDSEGGLREPWAGGDPNHDRGLDTLDIDEWLREVGLDATYPEPPWRDSSTRGSSRIVTDSEATVRGRRRVEALAAALVLLAYAVAAFCRSKTNCQRQSESPPPAVRRRRRQALTAALVLWAYAVAAFCWSNTDWQRQSESPPPPQNQPSLDEQAQSALTVLSPGVLQGSHNLTVEELAILKGIIFIFPICSFGGAVAALLVRGRRDPRLHRRPRGRSFPGVTPQPRQRCRRGNS
jgi:hypothetical protein